MEEGWEDICTYIVRKLELQLGVINVTGHLLQVACVICYNTKNKKDEKGLGGRGEKREPVNPPAGRIGQRQRGGRHIYWV